MTYANYENLLIEQQGSILTITINRPEARNAINAEMASTMGAAIDQYGFGSWGLGRYSDRCGQGVLRWRGFE